LLARCSTQGDARSAGHLHVKQQVNLPQMLPLLFFTLIFGVFIILALAIVCLPPVQRE
jgi:hypothetical protein